MNSTITQAVILAGGEGRRLLPYTKVLPKPLWPVGNIPIVVILIKQLAASGVTDIIMAVGHQAELIKTILGNGSQFGVKIKYSIEYKPLGTAGPLRKMKGLNSDFLVLNGDILTNLPLADLIASHLNNKSIATIAVHRRSFNVDFGIVEHKNNMVVKYLEKPKLKYLVSMGIYVFNKAIVKQIPNGKFDFPQLVNKLIKSGMNPFIYKFDGHWLDIGRTEDWEQADRLFQRKSELFLSRPE
ncbi:MAG: sugar phosphate nucleotidyltransferase [Candidatus Zixiibacteriota bacterium]